MSKNSINGSFNVFLLYCGKSLSILPFLKILLCMFLEIPFSTIFKKWQMAISSEILKEKKPLRVLGQINMASFPVVPCCSLLLYWKNCDGNLTVPPVEDLSMKQTGWPINLFWYWTLIQTSYDCSYNGKLGAKCFFSKRC